MGFRQDLLISPFSCPEQRLHTGFVFTCFGLLLILVLLLLFPIFYFIVLPPVAIPPGSLGRGLHF
jgi:hypothetical protein